MIVEHLDYSCPSLGPRLCRVRVGAGAAERLADDLTAEPPAHRYFVISDSNVAPLYGGPLAERLAGAGLDAKLVVFSAGEESKTRETKAAIEDRLIDHGAARDSAIVAVGGGVTGDLAGFVAATWHRGVPLIQVPTSLLAMVDATLGGKTAVNVPAGKNLVGAFHQPWGIYADVACLDTLGDAELVEGFAEVVKAATIADAHLFECLESWVGALLARDREALTATVAASLRVKRDVVVADERESGVRTMLNFGHTIGHALEAASGYTLSHGRAVAIGMSVEGQLAVERCRFPRESLERLRALLRAFGLPTRPTPDVDPDAVVAGTATDKKRVAGRTRCALPEALGRMPAGAGRTVEVEPEALRAALEASLAAG
jgi:3-dehydroquinate synthase